MTVRIFIILTTIAAVFSNSTAQEHPCDTAAREGIWEAQVEYSGDVAAMFEAIAVVEADWRACGGMGGALQAAPVATAVPTLVSMSTGQVIDGGHIKRGLWEIHEEYTLTDTCRERLRRESGTHFAELYYNEGHRLIWDEGDNYANFTFEFQVAKQYIPQVNGRNWVYELEIETASPTQIAGRRDGFWQGNKNFWCTQIGTFTATFLEGQGACLVTGDANIRTHASTRAPINGKIEGQRRAYARVPGDQSYHWFQLSDDEFVREDVVGSSRDCEEL